MEKINFEKISSEIKKKKKRNDKNEKKTSLFFWVDGVWVCVPLRLGFVRARELFGFIFYIMCITYYMYNYYIHVEYLLLVYVPSLHQFIDP